jgi:hypothetical protein
VVTAFGVVLLLANAIPTPVPPPTITSTTTTATILCVRLRRVKKLPLLGSAWVMG